MFNRSSILGVLRGVGQDLVLFLLLSIGTLVWLSPGGPWDGVKNYVLIWGAFMSGRFLPSGTELSTLASMLFQTGAVSLLSLIVLALLATPLAWYYASHAQMVPQIHLRRAIHAGLLGAAHFCALVLMAAPSRSPEYIQGEFHLTWPGFAAITLWLLILAAIVALGLVESQRKLIAAAGLLLTMLLWRSGGFGGFEGVIVLAVAIMFLTAAIGMEATGSAVMRQGLYVVSAIPVFSMCHISVMLGYNHVEQWALAVAFGTLMVVIITVGDGALSDFLRGLEAESRRLLLNPAHEYARVSGQNMPTFTARHLALPLLAYLDTRLVHFIGATLVVEVIAPRQGIGGLLIDSIKASHLHELLFVMLAGFVFTQVLRAAISLALYRLDPYRRVLPMLSEEETA